MARVACTLVLVGCSSAPPQPVDRFEIAWGGDILLGDAATDNLETHGHAWAFERIEQLISADYLVGNAEGPITSVEVPYFPDQEFSYNADPLAATALAGIGFDAVGLSNNHALDRGPDGLRDTIANLTAAEVAAFGAGTRDEAESPHLVDTPSGLVAIVALSDDWRYGAEASSTTMGTISITPEAVRRGHEMAEAAGARWIIAFVHWGENYSGITQSQRDAAKLFADAGYDLVVGHHPHIVQEVDVIDGMPVLYSLGNLAFGTPGRFEAGDGYGLIVTTAVGPEDAIEVSLACIVTDNDMVEFQPEPCAAAEAERLFHGLGDFVHADGNRGVVDTGD